MHSISNRYLYLGLIFVISFLVLAVTSHSQVTSKDQTFTIAALLPLTGEAASVGMYAKRSIELAYDELQPELKSKIKLIIQDDGMDPKKSISAFRMISSTQPVDAVIAMTSGIGHALAPLTEKQGVLTIIVGASDKTFATNKEFVFIHWVSPEAEAAQMVNELKKRNYNKIAMVSHIHQGVTAYNDVFLSLMRQAQLVDRIVMNESVPVGTNDFNSLLTKLRALKADGIFLGMFTEGLANISRRIKELGVSGEIFGAEFFEDEHVVKASRGALIGSWYVNIDDPSKEFSTKYHSRYNEYPGIACANAYDAINLLSEGFLKYGRDNKQISTFLKTLNNYKGAAGIYSSTDDNRFTLQATTKVVKADGFQKIN